MSLLSEMSMERWPTIARARWLFMKAVAAVMATALVAKLALGMPEGRLFAVVLAYVGAMVNVVVGIVAILSDGSGRRTLLLVFVVFGLLGLVSLAHAAAGLPTCGCFGAASVNPWWTFSLSSAIAAGAVILLPGKSVST